MDKEVGMGLRWTFMPVNWRKLEPNGPVNLTIGVPAAWKEWTDGDRSGAAESENPKLAEGAWILGLAAATSTSRTAPPLVTKMRRPCRAKKQL